MSDNLEVAKECGAFIEAGFTSEPDGSVLKEPIAVEFSIDQFEAYTSRILASQQAAHDAEIARLKDGGFSESKDWKESDIAGRIDWLMSRVESCREDVVSLTEQLSTANERIAYLEGLVAVKDEGLKDAKSVFCSGQESFLDDAIYATAETVQAFRDKLTEPLRGQLEEANSLANMQDIAIEQLKGYVAMLNHALLSVDAYLVSRGIEHRGKTGRTVVLPKIRAALNDTQATAQAYEQEMKREVAVEVLEEASSKCQNGYDAAMVAAMAKKLRATSKKG